MSLVLYAIVAVATWRYAYRLTLLAWDFPLVPIEPSDRLLACGTSLAFAACWPVGLLFVVFGIRPKAKDTDSYWERGYADHKRVFS